LPADTSSTNGDAHIDDYMPLHVVSNVTNVPQQAPQVLDTGAHDDLEQHTAENSAENDTENEANESQTDAEQGT
jgi:hypothetical protein